MMKKTLFLLIFLIHLPILNAEINKTEYSHTAILLFDDYSVQKEVIYFESTYPGVAGHQKILDESRNEFQNKILKILVNNRELFPLSDKIVKEDMKCQYEKCDFTEGYGYSGTSPLNLWIF